MDNTENIENLEKLQEKLIGDVAQETGPGGDKPSSGSDGSVVAGVAAHAVVSKFSGLTTAVHVAGVAREDLAKSHPFVGGGKPGDIFGGGSPEGSKFTRTMAPLVPLSYKDKIEQAKNTGMSRSAGDDVFARAQISGQSTKFPFKGATVTDKMTGTMKNESSKQLLAAVSQAIQKAPEDGSRRMWAGLKEGRDPVERHVQKNPDAVKNASPQVRQSLAPGK